MSSRMGLISFVNLARKLNQIQGARRGVNFVYASVRRCLASLQRDALSKCNSNRGHDRCKSLILTATVGLSGFVKTKRHDDPSYQSAEKTSVAGHQDNDSQIILLLKYARLFEMKQEFDRAEEYYHRALNAVNVIQQHRTWSAERVLQARLYIYDGMANLALVRGQLVPAEKLFKEVLQGLLQQGKQPNDNAIVEVSLKLAVIYAAQDRTEEADIGYQFCVETLEAKLNDGQRNTESQLDSDTIALLGMSSEAYARFLIARKDYVAALANLQKSLKIATDVLGDSHHQIVILLNDIATVASLSNDYDTANTTIRRAVSIAEQTDHAHLPALYCNLGAICSHKGNYAEANKHYGAAATLAKRINDKETLLKAEEALKNLKGRV